MLNVSARSDAPAAATAAHALRRECRRGAMTEQTSGRAAGFVQANLVVLPAAYAYDFLGFSHRNPRPCPLIGFTDVGEPSLPSLGTDVDLRTDLPRYRVWESGELVDEPTDIRHLWRDDLVAFAIGCSFTFEAALIADGIPLRHIEQGRNVAMYRTSIDTLRCGRFHGPMVVSMRPMTPPDAIRAIQVTSRYPGAHGAPVHIGYPAGIGIADLHRPDYGDAVEVCEGELPVFWACGVTPQAVIAAAAPAFAITHAPGCMLVTDIPNADLALS